MFNYLVITLQHPLVILVLRPLARHEGRLLPPPINTKILRPVDTFLPNLNGLGLVEFGSVFLLPFCHLVYLDRLRGTFVFLLFVIMIVIVIVIVVVVVVVVG